MNKNDIFKIGIGTWKVDSDNFERDIEALKYSFELGQKNSVQVYKLITTNSIE